jgi:N6-L-threonylcarbamoyladenine synthase
MKEDKTILSHIVYSQKVHIKHGGVVPELASRAHLEILQQITKEALKESGIKLDEINLFSATCGPGLIGGLLIGSTFTKSLSIGNNKPFIPINHLEGHILSSFYNNEIKFPHLSLLITGGHTQIYFLKNYNNISLIGETIDDAIGEAFDKVAKILGLPYPGGPEIEKRAIKGNENSYLNL